MRYLITGGAGFIGSHLTDRLLEDGHRVHVLDNLSAGRLDNIRHWRSHQRFALTVGSVLDEDVLGRCVSACDRIVHLAAAVGSEHIMDRPVEAIATNVRGTENVLRLARHHGARTLVASSAAVYGKAMSRGEAADPVREGGDLTLGATTERRWAYACSKATGEFLAQAYHEKHGCPVVCVRFFDTAGPRQSGRYGMVVPTFVKRALSGTALRVPGDGTQTRSVVHVADAVRAVRELLEVPAAEGRVFNVGREADLSLRQLAERVRSVTGSDSEIRHVPSEDVYDAEPEEERRRIPDLSKLKAAIGYEARYTITDIVEDIRADLEGRQGTRSELRTAAENGAA